VRDAVERQEVMLAKRIKRDVLQDDHFVVARLEVDAQDLTRIDEQTGEDFGVHVGNPARRPAQPFSRRVFANRGDQFGYGCLHAVLIDAPDLVPRFNDGASAVPGLFGLHQLSRTPLFRSSGPA